MQLPQVRVLEVVFILKELHLLSNFLQGHSASNFLLDLMPILTDLIVTNSKEIKDNLRLIFVLISKEVVKLKLSKSTD